MWRTRSTSRNRPSLSLIRGPNLRILFGFRRPTAALGWPRGPERFYDNTRVDERTMATSIITDDKKKALNLAISQIEKNCGKGSIMRMGTDTKVKVESIPTGAINLDAA